MNLLPSEADVVRRLLLGESVPAASGFASVALYDRLTEEAPPLGAHVFRLVCELGSDAAKKVAANSKERRELREHLGVKRLGKGQGPAKVVPLMAATLNEYNALEPWRKEALRKAYDAEIERLKKHWPTWSCGCVDRVNPAERTRSGEPKVSRESGRRRVVVVMRYSSIRPDETTVDVLGGKIAVDRLVQAGVLRGDTLGWLARYGGWVRAAPGEGRVEVDVYEVG